MIFLTTLYICNVNLQAYNGLARFEGWAKQQFIASAAMHVDEIVIYARYAGNISSGLST
jgi:dihydroneopterin aldolase